MIAYTEYAKENSFLTAENKSDISQAYKYLANYHLKRNQLEPAYQHAQKCLNYEEV